MKKPASKRIGGLFVIAVILFYLFGLYQRAPHIDDAWIGEQVWWLNKEGSVKNVLMRHNLQNEKRLLVYHKLWVWQGWLSVKIFGFSLYVLKSVSLVYLLLLYYLLWYYMVKVKQVTNTRSFVFAGSFLLLHPLIFKYSFVYRPEIALAATGMAIFILTERILENRTGKTAATAAGAALLSGAAFLIHMNGLIYILTTGLLLLVFRRYKALGIYSVVTIAMMMIYFLEIKTESDFLLWKHQMTLFSETEGFSLIKLLIVALKKLFDEQLRWFHSPAEIGYAVLLLIVVIKGYHTFLKKYPFLLYYALLSSLLLAFVGINKTVKYLIPVLPFYFILTVIYFVSPDKKYDFVSFFSLKRKYLFLRIWTVITVITGIIYDVQTATVKFNPELFSRLSEQYIHPDPRKTVVLAPMQFFYNERGKYKAIVGLFSYQERLSDSTGLNSHSFFQTAKTDSVNYIILNEYNRKLFHINELEMKDTVSGYVVIEKDKSFTVFKSVGLE